MRDYGRISTKLWMSRKFRSIKTDDRARLLYCYLHSCPTTNSIGCFVLPKGYARTDLHWSDTDMDRAIQALCDASLIAWNEGEELVRIVDFLDHSPLTNAKHAAGAVKLAIALPDCEQKARVCKDLLADPWGTGNPALTRALIALSEDHDTTETETETETEEKSSLRSDVAPPAADDGVTEAEGEQEAEELPPHPKVNEDVDEAFRLWNEVAVRTDLPAAQILNARREKALRVRLRECGGLSGWRIALAKIEASSFCKGANDSGWRAGLDFLLQAKSFTKLMEGSYDDRRPVGRPGGGGTVANVNELIERAREIDQRNAQSSSLVEIPEIGF